MSGNLVFFERDSLAGAFVYDIFRNIESWIETSLPNTYVKARMRLMSSSRGRALRLEESEVRKVVLASMVAIELIAYSFGIRYSTFGMFHMLKIGFSVGLASYAEMRLPELTNTVEDVSNSASRWMERLFGQNV